MSRPIGRAFALVVCLHVACARAACHITNVEMPVTIVASRAVATVEINGTPVPLMVDTGAFASSLTEAATARLGLTTRHDPSLFVDGLTGPVDARVTTVASMKVVQREVAHVDFMVGGNEPGAGTMGVMGRNILAVNDTEFDLANGMIRLAVSEGCDNANMAYWAGSAPVSDVALVRDEGERRAAIRANVKLKGTRVRALFDTGATSLVSLRAARRSGIAESHLAPAGAVFGAGRGSLPSWTARFTTFEFGRETRANRALPVVDYDLKGDDMIVGIDFFLSHRIYVSKAQSRMYFTHNGRSLSALDRRDTAE